MLRLIMTHPMVVARWTDFQHQASTVDDRRDGSGNETRHRVVVRHIGVFEGSGELLRQTIGYEWIHPFQIDGAQSRVFAWQGAGRVEA